MEVVHYLNLAPRACGFHTTTISFYTTISTSTINVTNLNLVHTIQSLYIPFTRVLSFPQATPTYTLSLNPLCDFSHPFQSLTFMAALNDIQLTMPTDNNEQKQTPVTEEDFDYSQRSQWLRAAVLGANDGLVSIASLMVGVGGVKKDIKAMILTGFAGLVAGACSMAIGEFVSVYSQRDIEISQMKRESEGEEGEKDKLPNPMQAAVASAFAFSLGAVVPLLAAAFIGNSEVRLGVVVAAVTLALVVFGGVGAVLGGSPVVKSCARVLVGGWLAMAITFGLTKLISTTGL